jgi:hypothetical protein
MKTWRHEKTETIHLKSAAKLSNKPGPPLTNMAAAALINLWKSMNYGVRVAKNIHSKLVVIDRGTNNAISYWGSLNPLSFSNTTEINTRMEGRELAEELINMSLVRNLHTYKMIDINKTQIQKDKIQIAIHQFKNLRWALAGLYHRPIMATFSNNTRDQILQFLPRTTEEYEKIEGFRNRRFILWKHLEEIEDIIGPLREEN